MNKLEWERMKRYTHDHVHDPQPGDHFTEMLGSVAYIEARDRHKVTLRRTNVAGGHKGWGPTETIPVSEFVRWASYGHGVPGYWLTLYPPQWSPELLEGG
jgi:hypothetical protein